MLAELGKGVILQGAVTNFAAAGNANAAAIFQLSNWANQMGNKSFRLKRLLVVNNAAGNTYIHIGTGAAGAVVDAIPALLSLNGLNTVFGEDDLPDVEFFADMMAYISAVAAAGTVDIMAEVEELG